MEEEVKKRLDQIEASLKENKRDFWDKLQVVSTAMVPLVIAALGWYFTQSYNDRQIKLSEVKTDQENNLENSKLNIVQVQMIRDFSPQLTGKDSTGKEVAIAALLYAAPALGKTIADIFTKQNPGKGTGVADLYRSKRRDLITGLFDKDSSKRQEAYGEISTSWQSDDKFLVDLLTYCEKWFKTKNDLIDVDNGIYNSMIVLNGFPIKGLEPYREKVKKLIKEIPGESSKTLKIAAQIKGKLGIS
ncbi:hypothetical protein OQX61_23855 [Pedobacter sp. PLR]|uniref:hypothetical protein n=1 Tax=Pedobacter sp. PLR TaxID=2994465 RepID=UPI002245D760|nr:hypothetical protein [Pedobacter sp. PLR]MCX2454326.1 hypothetical protein [Pedobacter sp. PLR]